jgi:hypothetical protein
MWRELVKAADKLLPVGIQWAMMGKRHPRARDEDGIAARPAMSSR